MGSTQSSVQTTTDWRQRFSAQAQRTSPPDISWLMAQALETPGMISLAAGFVDQETLPHREAASVLHAMMESPDSGPKSLQYGTTQGDLELRTALIERLHREGVFHPSARLDESHCLIGSGSQQILYLAAEALLDEGDIVLVEAPTYFVVLGVFRSRGARMIGIDTDEYGLIPEHLETCLEHLKHEGVLSRVKMLYLMTYATNPLGVTLPQDRRSKIFSILNQYRDQGFPILLLEDAAYRRLMFEKNAPAPIKSLEEENDLILYTESFSKSISPGVRLGFGVGPKALINKMVDLKGNHDFGSGNLSQQMMKAVLQEGLFDQHLDTLRKVYARKRDTVLDILRSEFPPQASWLSSSGGFYTWITLPSSLDTGPDGAVFQAAIREKVLYVPGSLCYSPDRPESRHSSAIRLSFGMIGEEPLREGCHRLAKAIRQSL